MENNKQNLTQQVTETIENIVDKDYFIEEDFMPIEEEQLVSNDSNYYKKLGFFSSIERKKKYNKYFRIIIKEHRQNIDKKVGQIENTFFLHDIRSQRKISETKKILEQEKINLVIHESEVQSLFSKKQELEENLLILKKERKQLYEQVGNKKEKLIENRINEVNDEIKQLIKNYKEAYEKRFEINQITYNDNKKALDIKIHRFEKLKKEYEERYEESIKTVNNLRQSGITPFIANFLISVGFSATLIAGYFFSIFSLSKMLNDENFPFFIIYGLHSFANGLFTNVTLGDKFFILFGALCGILLFITLISWLSYLLGNKLNDAAFNNRNKNEDTINRMVFELSNSSGITFEAKSQSSDFFRLWINLLPLFFIIGFIFIFVLLGADTSQIEKLDISLTGTTIGVLITLALTPLIFIYISKVIEPRIEKNVKNSNLNFQKGNIELIIAIVIFITSFFLLLFVNSGPHPVSIAVFISSIVSTSFLLAYGLRFKGLLSSASFLERRINALYDAIKDNSRPRPINLTSFEDRRFKKEYFDLQKQLYTLIKDKNELSIKVLSGTKILSKRNGQNEDSRKRLFFFLPIVRKGETLSELNALEERYFPKYKMVLEEINMAIAEKRTEGNSLSLKIMEIKERNSILYRKIVESIKRLNDRLDGLERERIKRVKQKNDLVQRVMDAGELQEIDIREGFNLGIWFRENKIGPTENFYFNHGRNNE